MLDEILGVDSAAERIQLRIVWGPQSKLLSCWGTVSITVVHCTESPFFRLISFAKSSNFLVMASRTAGNEVRQLSCECRVCVLKSRIYMSQCAWQRLAGTIRGLVVLGLKQPFSRLTASRMFSSRARSPAKCGGTAVVLGPI